MIWEEIRGEAEHRGEKIIRRLWNARIDNRDVDLLIVTDKNVYVVEVKVKPKISDVRELVAKARLVKNMYKDQKVIPILAGALINTGVEKYALKPGVEVKRY